ncbi:hypothetical protein [Chitinivorax sp. B]|uniref:hypothetical protein n=1 Tax=Chitinivorax sp. B TaxID=2502235 RepID=UPI0010F9F7C8|nr:hypothetical protein [Chitinivorax sp. B]
MNANHVLLRDFIYTDPVLCMDITTGEWRNATELEYPPETEYIGDAPNPIRGIYIVNKGQHFFRYATPNDRVIFRDDAGSCIEIDGHIYAVVEPSKDLAGEIEPDYNLFQLFHDNGQLLYQFRYEATLYRKLYETELMTGTGANVIFGDLTLGDWDFFYNMIDACSYVKNTFSENQANGSQIGDTPAMRLRCDADQPCPRTGWWWSPAAGEQGRQHFEQGQILPKTESDYGTTIWYWEADRQN